jgi:hypothetical protein
LISCQDTKRTSTAGIDLYRYRAVASHSKQRPAVAVELLM